MAIHRYFSSMTSQEIKARGLQEDKPLRMAKTLLHKICGLAVSTGHANHVRLAVVTKVKCRSYCISLQFPDHEGTIGGMQ